MSKDAVIICYGYEGESSKMTNAICLFNIISNLSNKDSVTIITGGLDRDETEQIIDGVTVANIIRSQVHIKQELKLFKQNAINYISRLIEKENIKTVVAVSFPYVTGEIGSTIKIKYPNVRFLLYELDPYAYNSALRLRYVGFPYRYYKELKIFSKADKIFLTSELYNRYTNGVFRRIRSKLINLGIPMLKIREDQLSDTKSTNCDIVFTGIFSKKFRDPTLMLKLFLLLKDKGNWILNIYGASKSTMDAELLNQLGNRVIIHPRISRADVLKILNKASILINISNTMNDQLPSKILDYIGLRKPVINFYRIDDDLSNQYLKKYPIRMLIDERNGATAAAAEDLFNFIETNQNKYCDFDAVYAAYKDITIENIASKFEKQLTLK